MVPDPIDPVKITNIISAHLERNDENHRETRDARIVGHESIMVYISFFYAEAPEISRNEIFHGIIRRNSVLQQILVDVIPDCRRDKVFGAIFIIFGLSVTFCLF